MQLYHYAHKTEPRGVHYQETIMIYDQCHSCHAIHMKKSFITFQIKKYDFAWNRIDQILPNTAVLQTNHINGKVKTVLK